MNIVNRLKAALGDAAVLTGSAIDPRYCSDKSKSGQAAPFAVVRPRSTDEVSSVLRLCHETGTAVVPQGGMTGLAGGGNPSDGAVAISLELMRGIEEIDRSSSTMTVLAGTPLEAAQQAAAEADFFLALDLGSRGTCQIGGNLATNAGGIRVIRYGMAREQVLGLEVVLADGAVLSSLNKMLKNNAGYDLKQLFIGSEGTLGIITRAVLKLHPLPSTITTALCALEDYDKVVALLREAQKRLGNVMAFEAMWQGHVEYNLHALGLTFFAELHPFWVILEATEATSEIEGFLETCAGEGLIRDAIIAQSEAQARSIWSVREGLAVERLPHLINYDVSLPISSIGSFADNCFTAVTARWPGAHCTFFGHVGDSNLHVSVSAGPDTHAVDETVYGTLRQFGGSISAEHGIGTLKRPYLGFSRSEAELALMRTIKKAIDPKGILNPGKVI